MIRPDRRTVCVVALLLALLVGAAGYPCATARVPLRALESKYWRTTEQTITSWMAHWQPPIGLYVGQDMVGRLVAQLCRDRGWRVPQDVAINTGFNEQTVCEHPRPSLSSVEMGYERVGLEAARLLDRLMNEKKRKKKQESPPENILVSPLGLVARESTDFFAVDDSLVAAALEFIAAHSHQSIRPEDVARAVATELRTLQRRFRTHLDRGIADEIRRVRIERAKRELAQTDHSIKSIAPDVGFGEPMQMYQVFCREVGVSPKEYRKQRRLKDGP